MSKIQKFVPEYIRRYGREFDEFDAKEIVRRYLNDEFIFELPAVITQAEGSSTDIPNCKLKPALSIPYFPTENLVE